MIRYERQQSYSPYVQLFQIGDCLILVAVCRMLMQFKHNQHQIIVQI